MTQTNLYERGSKFFSLGNLNFGHFILSFDFAQDREPVERLAEPFRISDFVLRIYTREYGEGKAKNS
jgi:hypothetical protein